ncbi:MAG TPA: ATP synthase F1 subunit delta [Thermoanaerobaculia bacterium]|nr:ATP synthase F1 subunit delta [Thermoanaerobaculia bacterium]
MSSFLHPYARAFLECAPKGYDVGAFLGAAEALASILEANPAVRGFLRTPAVPAPAKSKAIAALATRAGLDAYGARFLQVLLRHHRLLEAGAVFKAVREAYDALQGIVRARITVAAPIAEDEKKMIEQAIAERTGKTVRSQVDVDSKILAGFIAHVGSNVYDGSAAAAIRRFQQQVKEQTGA